MITKSNLVHDLLYFLKNDLSNNVTDPIVSSRPTESSWVMTSYPQKKVVYPLITLKCTNATANQAGMQTTAQDMQITVEVRIWARNEKEKDSLYDSVINRLANNQFTASTGSVANAIYNLKINSSTEIDEEGDQGIKSRVVQVNYNFYDQ